MKHFEIGCPIEYAKSVLRRLIIEQHHPVPTERKWCDVVVWEWVTQDSLGRYTIRCVFVGGIFTYWDHMHDIVKS